MHKNYYIYSPKHAKEIERKSPYLGVDITGSGVLFQVDRKILLHLRDEKSGIRYPNMWSVFGGRVKTGEIPRHTLEREMKEELDIVLMKKDIKPFFEFIEMGEGSHLFLVNAKAYLEKMKLQGEGRDMFAFSREEMRGLENLVPYLDKYFNVWWDAFEKRI